MIPQLVYVLVSGLVLCIHAVRHGQPMNRRYDVIGAFVAALGEYTILASGGFFDPILDRLW